MNRPGEGGRIDGGESSQEDGSGYEPSDPQNQHFGRRKRRNLNSEAASRARGHGEDDPGSSNKVGRGARVGPPERSAPQRGHPNYP